MNWIQVQGIIERILTIGLTYAVAKGWVGQDMVANIIQAVIAVGAVGWALWKGTATNQVAATISLPEVKKIETTPAIAAAIPSADVVPARP